MKIFPVVTDVPCVCGLRACVRVCVCLLDTTVSPRNTAEPIEMLFGMFTGPRNHVLGGTLIPDIPGERAIFGGMSKPTENYWKHPA